MPSELMIADEKRTAAVDYLKRWIGTPYIYGGDDFSGMDCNGIMHEVLQGLGIEVRGYDATAHGMWFDYMDKEVAKGYAGCLVFWFRANGVVQHVAMMIDNARIVHAAGGTGDTLTEKDAIRQNAYIRMDDFGEYSKYRGQEYKICDPFLVRSN